MAKSGSFSEEEFNDAYNELDNPQLDTFELFVEVDEIKIYRRYNESSGLYEYKVTGYLNINTDLCFEVYMDLDYRKSWDSYVKELYSTTADDQSVIYWNVNFPFPMSNRDYTYIREMKKFNEDGDRRAYVVLARSHKLEALPPKSKVIRVDDYKQYLIGQRVDDTKTKLFMYYFDNPGGSIPTWLINWAAKKGVPNFLSDMQKACDKYAEYQKKTMGS